MATKSKSLKTGYLRRNIKPGSKSRPKMRWRNLRLTFEEEASKQGRINMVNATVRKYLRREQKRIQLANLVDDMGIKEDKSRYEAAESHAITFRPLHSAGGMAPANTTQYLMANVYEDICDKDGDYFNSPVSSESCSDMYGESLSPLSVYVALDSAYERCLAFQQRDFEEVFSMCAKC